MPSLELPVQPTLPETTEPPVRPVVRQPGTSLRKNFSWTFVGNAVYAACQWGMLIVLAKLGDAAMVGQFALGLAITTPVFMLTDLQLRSILVTDPQEQYQFGDYLGLRLVMTVLGFLAVTVICLAAGYRSSVLQVIMSIGVVKAIEAVGDVCHALMQRRERMDFSAKAQIMKGILAVIGMALCIWWTESLLAGILAWAVAAMLTLFLWTLPRVVELLRERPEEPEHDSPSGAFSLRPRLHWPTLSRLAWLSLPLGFVTMLISLNTNLPRFVIERYVGEEELGLFASLAYLLVAGGMVSNAIGQAAAPRLANYFAANNLIAFRRLVLQMMAIGVGLGAAGVLLATAAGAPILSFVYTPEYAQHIDVLVWLTGAAGLGFVASFLGYAITAARYFRAQVPLFSVVFVVTLVAAFLLIPAYGLRGAAWTSLFAAVTQLVGSAAILWIAIRSRSSRDVSLV